MKRWHQQLAAIAVVVIAAVAVLTLAPNNDTLILALSGGAPQAALGAEAVPEPSTIVLAALGLLGLCACAQRRQFRLGH